MRRGPPLELATVMHSAPMISNSSRAKLMCLIGPKVRLMRTLVVATMAPAVWNSISGRPIVWPLPTPFTPAILLGLRGVKELTVAIMLATTGTMVYATRMVAISIIGEWEIKTTLDPDQTIRSTQQN